MPRAKTMVVLGYPDIGAAGDGVRRVLPHEPWQLEGLDQVLVDLEKEAGLAKNAIPSLPSGGGLAHGAVHRCRPGRGGC